MATKKAETAKKAVKEETKKAADAAKKTAEKAEKAVKETAKKVEKKTETVKKAAEKKAETVKKAAEKKAPAKKSPAKKAAPAVYFEFAGKQINVDDIKKAVEDAYVSAGNKASSIKSADLYVKAEDSAVYFVINGTDKGKVIL